jgi:hypothetical protein
VVFAPFGKVHGDASPSVALRNYVPDPQDWVMTSRTSGAVAYVYKNERIDVSQVKDGSWFVIDSTLCPQTH